MLCRRASVIFRFLHAFNLLQVPARQSSEGGVPVGSQEVPLRSHTPRSGGGQKVGEEENATVILVTVVGLSAPGVLVSPGERGVSKTTSLPFRARGRTSGSTPPAPRALVCLHVAVERWTELGTRTGGPSACLLWVLVSAGSTHVCRRYTCLLVVLAAMPYALLSVGSRWNYDVFPQDDQTRQGKGKLQ